MKKMSKYLIGSFALLLIISSFLSVNVAAAIPPTDKQVPIASDHWQAQVNANEMTMFAFQFNLRLRFRANVNLTIEGDCETRKLANKDFILEIEGDDDLRMNMTCTEEQKELGLMMGNTYQIRNRNRVQYQEGFVCNIECNGTFLKAQIRIRATNENRVGSWAYYDEATEEWVTVPTTIEDDYLTAEVSHFSYWTVLIPDYTMVIIVSVFVGAIAVAIVGSIIYVRKKKRTSN
ncbi:MAG: hypothetical protein EU552_02100 [Promethearchaeota archaeon]|nr:MAG: hypothetical protein EU552_02100 [Candidatus Lokiarchaeota archaeon]